LTTTGFTPILPEFNEQEAIEMRFRTCTLAVAIIAIAWLTSNTSAMVQDQAKEETKVPPIAEKTAGMERHDGYFPFYWDDKTGKIWLEIPRFEEEFLYVNSLRTGLGSNPVGLDRGQLGRDRVVKFVRVGPKVLLWQRNLRYRALTDNPAEKRAVEESFAQSILWGAKIAAESDGRVLVDATDFLLRDAHNVIGRLKQRGQGTFKLDTSRSAVYLPRTKAFPDNTEFEVILTFSTSEPGPLVVETTPSPEAVTVRQHHSFIKLPDADYQPRRFDSRAGSFGISFADYAAPLDQPLQKRYIARHRLKKKDPTAAVSEPVEPIVYYVDPGAPEPVRSALIEGASWWNEAFEAAGFKNAFRVELLPEDADPLDVRYNVIQWVHRSTRGWSYGGSVIDPRTGEIIKGHVTLGSLRVRQDRLLFEGLEPLFSSGSERWEDSGFAAFPEESYLAALDPNTDAVEVALARIRQLAAHEVGHTLGFAHNFAASTYGRASVMDYPAPLVKVTPSGDLDLSDAYAVGVGAWDRWAVRYAYSEFPPGTDEDAALGKLVQEAITDKLLFITDADARPPGAAHPLANLWDNGADPVSALELEMKVRRIALDRFGERNIPEGRPLASLEETLVPLFLHHRYQLDATAKMLGGAFYTYAVRGDGQEPLRPVPPDRQRQALDALLKTVEPAELVLPESVLRLLPPQPFGYGDNRERFPRRTAMLFDPLAAASVAADMTISNLLQHERAARLVQYHARDQRYPGLDEVIDRLLDRTWKAKTPSDEAQAAVARAVERVVVDRLIDLAGNTKAAPDVRAIATAKLRELEALLRAIQRKESDVEAAHRRMAADDIARFLRRPSEPAKPPQPLTPPPGSPIGG
jgi:hypothetical protein